MARTGRSTDQIHRNSPSSSGDEAENAHSYQRREHFSSPPVDSIELFWRILWDTFRKLWLQLRFAFNFAMNELGGNQALDKIAQWGVRNPHKAVCLLVAGITLLFPLLIVLGIGLTTLLMTLTGFLVLEGTLLTVLSMLLFGFLGAAVIVLLFFTMVLVAIFFGFAHIYGLYGGVERCKRVLDYIMRSENFSRIVQLARRNDFTSISGEINVANGR